jgi:hypothetical protein
MIVYFFLISPQISRLAAISSITFFQYLRHQLKISIQKSNSYLFYNEKTLISNWRSIDDAYSQSR